MRVLAFNVGSSTVKFAAFENGSENELLHGVVDSGTVDDRVLSAVNLRLVQAGIGAPDMVAHRVAHGGDGLREPAVVDADVERAIEKAALLAPQHNPLALAGIRIARERWSQALQIAVFDTAFHADLPEHAQVYAVPSAWRELGVRRYGFHGLSHQHVMESAAKALACEPETLRIVSCHIGNGASVCAIDRGRSVDVSMGLTALEGLVMGTRSGDVDPGALLYVGRQLGLSLDAIEQALYRDSGLKSLSGLSADLREVELAASQGAPAAHLALQVHAYRVRKYIGAYVAVMGGVDVIAFTGGGGENSPGLRNRILTGLEFFGIRLDLARNEAYAPARSDMQLIQQDSSPVKVLVVHAREQKMLARAANGILAFQRSALKGYP